ncbi:MAG: alpha/beta fold hydrolase [Phreatobacter sp.]|uniref:alpha/beta fold hydrolase n=1 Tax=Phreatobacter sp. TaxID=1966341 RepID=UPI001A41B52E|nr:alpha/beta hydrolase [Phreatobacter sp.]MBL8571480.1 alpha/beta fold hydrolase [Phreatobacter sp.]
MTGDAALTDIGEGRPVVFLHGWSVDRSFFAGQHRLVDEGFRVIAPDQAGHRDGEVAGVLSIADLSTDLAALLAGLDRPALLVGWSMGATVALDHLARRGSTGIAGLVMVDMTPKVANDVGWRLGLSDGQSLDEAVAAAERMRAGWARYAPKIADALFAEGRTADAGLVAHARQVVAARDPAVMAHLWRSLVEADHRDTIRKLDIPVLALAGARSRLYRPEVAAWIAAQAPRGAAVSIADAGHTPHAEQPEAFNAALSAFAARL